jgi:hypothetical protein
MSHLSEVFLLRIAKCLQEEEMDGYVLNLYYRNEGDLAFFDEKDRQRVIKILDPSLRIQKGIRKRSNSSMRRVMASKERRLYKEFWKLRFLKMLKMEEEAISNYELIVHECHSVYKDHPSLETFFANIFKDERKHAALCRELLKIVDRQCD